MRAAVFVEPGKIEVDERPDPQIAAPIDAVVSVAGPGACQRDGDG